MGLFSRAADTFYTFRFLRLLTTPWEKTGAFKAGLIDANGKQIKKPETSNEKSVYNYFHRLVFNIKRLLNTLPFGKSTIASYLAALYLIKESYGVDENSIKDILRESFGSDVDNCMTPILESTWYLNPDGTLCEGTYKLLRSIPLPKTGELLALRNTNVIVESNCHPCGTIFGADVYKVYHSKTNRHIYITSADIKR